MILSPNASCLVVFAGVLLIYLELLRPGMVLPGSAGLGLLVWGAYGLWRDRVDITTAAFFGVAGFLMLLRTMWNTGFMGAAGALLCLGAGAWRLIAYPPHLSSVLVSFCAGSVCAISLLLTRAARLARQNKWRDLAG